jgi:hypothetical protein
MVGRLGAAFIAALWTERHREAPCGGACHFLGAILLASSAITCHGNPFGFELLLFGRDAVNVALVVLDASFLDQLSARRTVRLGWTRLAAFGVRDVLPFLGVLILLAAWTEGWKAHGFDIQKLAAARAARSVQHHFGVLSHLDFLSLLIVR